MKNNMSHYNMNKKDLKKLSKSELIKLLLKQDKKPVPAPRTVRPIRPIPAPRKSVNQMVQDYENNIILPPLEFRDGYKPVPAPHKSANQMVQDYENNIILPPLEFRDGYKPVPAPRTKKPVPLPRTKIQ